MMAYVETGTRLTFGDIDEASHDMLCLVLKDVCKHMGRSEGQVSFPRTPSASELMKGRVERGARGRAVEVSRGTILPESKLAAKGRKCLPFNRDEVLGSDRASSSGKSRLKRHIPTRIVCNISIDRALPELMTVRTMSIDGAAEGGDDLLRRARRSGEALGQLYERHYDGVFRYCIHRLFVREVAEDITSAVFLAVAGSIRTFGGRCEQDFRNWLFAIATNRINAHIRSSKRRQALLAVAAAQRRIRLAGEPVDERRPDWPSLYEAIASLKTKEQAVVTLRGLEQLPYEQVAATLGIKPSAARVRFNRALKKLRASLANRFGRA